MNDDDAAALRGELDRAFAELARTLVGFDDVAARGPSLLPGWTRGHVLTHLARNADGNRKMVEGAIAGEVRAQYPDGAEGRAADIETGAGRSAAELVEDLLDSQALLVAAWGRLPADGWDRLGDSFAFGPRPMTDGLRSRLRELLVHHVDLDDGFGPDDLPAAWVADSLDWLRRFRTAETWPGVAW
ncbi:MAG: maleylpyruvate isomerase family mycothiol-dependent enzyme [Actinobacteria bacterium]|nr:maleylpyruvate isomerase family mycothiol-dependent enzyme [Actinomycetota bacterium]